MSLLDRYIVRDLLRLTAMTTGILVVVIAFGAALEPLSSGKLLSLAQTAKYVVLATVPMLQFALPFAAGFAGTMSFHRLASDNEILAAAVAGLSYPRLLRPVALLGVVLLVVMVILTQWVIPRFWTLLERAVAVDIVRLFEATILRGEPFEFSGRQIYARNVIVESRPDGSEADTRLVLFDVTAADLDAQGRIDKDVTARQAAIDVYRRPDVTFLKLVMADTLAYDPEGGVVGGAERLVSKTVAIPTQRKDDTQQWTQGELLELRRDPDRFGAVARDRRAHVEAMQDEETWAELDARLAAQGALRLESRREGGPRTDHVVAADRVSAGRLERNGGGAIEVVQHRDGRPRLRMRAGEARLERVASAIDEALSFDLVLSDVEVSDVDLPDATNRRKTVSLENLAIEGLTRLDIADMPSAELLALARARADATGRAPAPAGAQLARRIERLQHDITSRLSMRYAMSITAPLLLLLGTVLAMWRRHSLPLTIYLWAFLPAVADLIVITSGWDVMRGGAVRGGFAVMWAGNAALVLLLVLSYRRLARH